MLSDGIGLPAGRLHGSGQLFFPGAIIHDATQSERATDFLAELAVAIRRPAFRAPASSRAQDDVPFDSKTSQELQHENFLNRRHSESHGRYAIASACAL